MTLTRKKLRELQNRISDLLDRVGVETTNARTNQRLAIERGIENECLLAWVKRLDDALRQTQGSQRWHEDRVKELQLQADKTHHERGRLQRELDELKPLASSMSTLAVQASNQRIEHDAQLAGLRDEINKLRNANFSLERQLDEKRADLSFARMSWWARRRALRSSKPEVSR